MNKFWLFSTACKKFIKKQREDDEAQTMKLAFQEAFGIHSHCILGLYDRTFILFTIHSKFKL